MIEKSDLIHHSEPGQYLSIRYADRLAEVGIAPSVDSVGESYDALAESINRLYRMEVIRQQRPLAQHRGR